MVGYKVGDFVRFKHELVVANAHIALAGDMAVVVGFSDDGKAANVVWNDGGTGSYRREKLSRCEGKIGVAVKAPKTPLRDYGHKPVPVPARVIPAPLPSKAVWAVAEERIVKGMKTKPTAKRPEGGYMRFTPPLIVVEVRACDWPQGQTIKMSRSSTAVTVTFPNGQKQSYTPTGARTWMGGKFGAEMAETLFGMLRLDETPKAKKRPTGPTGLLTPIQCKRDIRLPKVMSAPRKYYDLNKPEDVKSWADAVSARDSQNNLNAKRLGE